MKPQIEILKIDLQERIDKLLKDDTIELVSLKSIISKIHSLDFDDRLEFQFIYTKLYNELFKRSIDLPELDLDIFKKTSTSTTKSISQFDSDIFDKQLKDLSKIISSEYNYLRRYLLLHLKGTTQTKIYLLHDSIKEPFICSEIKNKIFPTECEIENLNDYVKSIKNDNKFTNSDHIILLLSTLNSSHIELKDKITELKSAKKQIALLKIDENLDYSEIIEKSKIEEEIHCSFGIELVNSAISYEMSRVIKKFYLKGNFHTLEYSLLSGGFSGSTVILIQPYKLGTSSIKSVIKINSKKEEKIQEEIDNFYAFVKDTDNKYTIDEKETENLIAIKYNYASSDSTKNSKSFSDVILDNPLNGVSAIDKLFNNSLLSKWSTLLQFKGSPFDLYKEYINVDDIFEVASLIDIQKVGDLRKYYENIISYTMTFNTKICHGDLHSENLYVDEDVYLIDFGHTKNNLHAVIDHTTLEASIKFRLVPFYISEDELIKIENELLSSHSFESVFEMKAPGNERLNNIFKIILKIRQYSNKNLHNNNIIEYYISLFMITLRQIKYSGLNQKYAFNSALIIGKYVYEFISNK